MPRKRRQESPTLIYHWIVRGMNKKHLFHDPADYSRFRDLVIEYKKLYDIVVYHYCLMSNHVHMLLRSESIDNLSQYSHYVQRRYAYYYCGKYNWTGSVFQRGYRSFVIDREEYLLECGRYIERNPVQAKICDSPKEYQYSSFQFYAKGKADELVTRSPSYLGLSLNEDARRTAYAHYVSEQRVSEEMALKGLLNV